MILFLVNLLIVSLQIKDEKGVYVMEKAIASITLPFLEFAKKTSNFVVSSFYTYVYNVNAQKKYYKLVKEVKKLKAEKVICDRLSDENKRLKSLLLIKYSYDFSFIGARVIDNMAFSGVNIITIDRGKRSGLRENLAVIDENGVVGRVWKLFPNQSQVQLISDNSSGVGVVLAESELGGILVGTGDLYYGKLKYIPNDASVKVGDMVYTSGTDLIYPPNLYIGKVVSIKKGDEFFLDIKVKFAANLSALRDLIIIVPGNKNE